MIPTSPPTVGSAEYNQQFMASMGYPSALAGIGSTDWVDPVTGALKRQPRTPDEIRSAKQALLDFSYNQDQGNWQAQMDTLDQSFKTPPIDTEGIINRGTEELAESERSSVNSLQNQLAASGGTTGSAGSGATSQGLASVASQFAGQRANLARDVRLDAAQRTADLNQQRTQMKLGLLARKPTRKTLSLEDVGSSGGGGGGGGTGWTVLGQGAGSKAYRPPPSGGRDSGIFRDPNRRQA